MRSWRIAPCDLKPGPFEMHVFFVRLEPLGAGARLPVRHAHEPTGRDRGCPRCQELYLRTLVAVQRVLFRLLGADGHQVPLHQETPGRLRAGDTGLTASLSRCRDVVAVAVSWDTHAEVSLQTVPSELPDHGRYPLTAREERLLSTQLAEHRPETLARLWTRKDAALRATGEGMSGRPQQVDAVTDTAGLTIAVPVEDGHAFRYVQVLDLPRLDHVVGALAAENLPAAIHPWLLGSVAGDPDVRPALKEPVPHGDRLSFR